MDEAELHDLQEQLVELHGEVSRVRHRAALMELVSEVIARTTAMGWPPETRAQLAGQLRDFAQRAASPEAAAHCESVAAWFDEPSDGSGRPSGFVRRPSD